MNTQLHKCAQVLLGQCGSPSALKLHSQGLLHTISRPFGPHDKVLFSFSGFNSIIVGILFLPLDFPKLLFFKVEELKSQLFQVLYHDNFVQTSKIFSFSVKLSFESSCLVILSFREQRSIHCRESCLSVVKQCLRSQKYHGRGYQ